MDAAACSLLHESLVVSLFEIQRPVANPKHVPKSENTDFLCRLEIEQALKVPLQNDLRMFTTSLLIQVLDNDILSWFFIRTDDDDNDIVVHTDKVCVHPFGSIDDDNGDDSDYDDGDGKDDGDDDDVKDDNEGVRLVAGLARI